MNAQCVVAADRTVLSCSCLTVGASHDATAWAASQLAQDFDAGLLPEQFALVGDDAYSASSEQIVTPYPGNPGEYEDACNYWISNSRIEVSSAHPQYVSRALTRCALTCSPSE